MTPPFHYSVFGLAIDSDIELEEPSIAPNDAPEIVIKRGRAVQTNAKTTKYEEFVSGRSLGAFQIRGGREIIVSPGPRVPASLLSVLLMGRFMAYLLRQRGWLPVHASAVQIGAEAILFVAPVGTGKSTTAAAFCSRGHSVLSDDVSPVRVVSGRCILQPGRSRLRLCEDTAALFQPLDPNAGIGFDKRDFCLRAVSPATTVPVKRIYLLENGDEFRIESIRSISALATLGKECFVRLQFADGEVLAAHLRDCVSVVSSGVVRKLVRPRNLALLSELVDFVEADLLNEAVASS